MPAATLDDAGGAYAPRMNLDEVGKSEARQTAWFHEREIYFFIVCLSVFLVTGYSVGFYVGAQVEAADQNSLSQQYRGWESLAQLLSDNAPDREMPGNFSTRYFIETQALAYRINELDARKFGVLKQKARGLAKVMPARLKPYAEALASCIERAQFNTSIGDCVHSAVPAESLEQLFAAAE
ncbi:MAG TPA: hypothetical protein VGC30_12345 [Dokdonella sp.]